jgi:hypothetical protein
MFTLLNLIIAVLLALILLSLIKGILFLGASSGLILLVILVVLLMQSRGSRV